MEERFNKLEPWLAAALGALKIHALKKLSGGAIQENWHLTTDQGEFVLRTDAPSTLSTSHSRPEEFAILEVAHKAGVMAPKPIALCENPTIIGAPFYLMEMAPGIAQARKIVRDPDLTDFGASLAMSLGAEMARLHKIEPPIAALDFLPMPDPSPAQSRINKYRRDLDALPDGHPVLEYALNWLEDHQPKASRVTLCHSDLRTGNYMVQDGQLTAILDWEFATWSDPMEDIGWICCRCWRFGNDHLKVGGVGTLRDFLGGYEAVSGTQVKTDQIPYWQVMGELRWAIIALQQSERCHQGETTLELALSAPLAAEMELNILDLIERCG